MKWKRREWVANEADPTQVIRWELKSKWFMIELVVSWGVSSGVRLGRFKWHPRYDAWWTKMLFSWLERRYEAEQAQYDEDPMGRLADYE